MSSIKAVSFKTDETPGGGAGGVGNLNGDSRRRPKRVRRLRGG